MLDTSGRQVACFRENMPGKAWWFGFMSRHPDLKLKNTEKLEIARAAACNETNIREWHNLYETVIQKYNINSPEYICNCDESALQPKTGKVLADKCLKNPYSVSGNSKTQITSLICITADEKVLPPFILFPGKSVNPSYALDFPPKSMCYATDSGWMTKNAFFAWIKNIFIPYWPDASKRGHILLLLDGHSSRVDYQTSKLCHENKIVLFCLPAHTNHLLQPLDKVFFGPLKSNWRKRTQQFMQEHRGTPVDKISFGRVFSRALLDTSIPSLVTTAFCSCGIWPVDASAIDYGKTKPADLFLSSAPKQTSSYLEEANRLSVTESISNEPPVQSYHDSAEDQFSYDALMAVPAELFSAEALLREDFTKSDSLAISSPVHVAIQPQTPFHPEEIEDFSTSNNILATSLSPVTKAFQALTPIQSQSRMALHTLEEKLSSSEKSLFYKRFEERCDIGDNMYMAWYHLRLSVENEDQQRKDDIRSFCEASNSSTLVRRELFALPAITRKSYTYQPAFPRLLTSDQALTRLQQKVQKRKDLDERKQKKKKINKP